MGSPVSVVVAKIVMQNIEEQALATYAPIKSLYWAESLVQIRRQTETETCDARDGG